MHLQQRRATLRGEMQPDRQGVDPVWSLGFQRLPGERWPAGVAAAVEAAVEAAGKVARMVNDGDGWWWWHQCANNVGCLVGESDSVLDDDRWLLVIDGEQWLFGLEYCFWCYLYPMTVLDLDHFLIAGQNAGAHRCACFHPIPPILAFSSGHGGDMSPGFLRASCALWTAKSPSKAEEAAGRKCYEDQTFSQQNLHGCLTHRSYVYHKCVYT